MPEICLVPVVITKIDGHLLTLSAVTVNHATRETVNLLEIHHFTSDRLTNNDNTTAKLTSLHSINLIGNYFLHSSICG